MSPAAFLNGALKVNQLVLIFFLFLCENIFPLLIRQVLMSVHSLHMYVFMEKGKKPLLSGFPSYL